jgi:hypothetical protein
MSQVTISDAACADGQCTFYVRGLRIGTHYSVHCERQELPTEAFLVEAVEDYVRIECKNPHDKPLRVRVLEEIPAQHATSMQVLDEEIVF